MTPSGRADKILAAMSPSDAKILDRRDLPEYVTAIVVIIISLGLYAFLKLTGEVVDGDTVGFDQQLLLMLRNPADLADPVGPEWLEVIVRDLTALGGAVTLGMLTIAVCGYFWLQLRPRMALFVLLAMAGGSLFNSLLKEFFERPLPLHVDPSGVFLFGNDGGEARAMLLDHDASSIQWEEAFSDPEDLSWYIVDVMPWLLPQHIRYVGQECASLMRAIREGGCYEQG